MGKTIDLAKELKKEIDDLPLFIEYKSLKAQCESNTELTNLKKEIIKAKAEHKDTLHQELLFKYNSHPLMINLKVLEEEVAEYLSQISIIINKK